MSEVLPVERIIDSETAFSFVLGVLFNQQMRADNAWRAPRELSRRLGGLTPDRVVLLGMSEFCQRFAESPAIHPFTTKMAANAFEAACIIVDKYDGDARNIWTPGVTASEFIVRLTQFPGVGEHKARIALFVATVQLGVVVYEDGGDYSIRSCASLAQMFHPCHEPIFTSR